MAREALLLTGDVAKILRVSGKTVNRWADQGLLRVFRTLGGPEKPGHRRFKETDVMAKKAEMEGAFNG